MVGYPCHVFMTQIKYPLLYFIGLSVLFAVYLVFILMFMTAYYDPTKSTLMVIDKWGEADIEFVILLGTFPLVLSVIFLMYKILFDKDEK